MYDTIEYAAEAMSHDMLSRDWLSCAFLQGFPGIRAGTPFLQIFYRNCVPAKHKKNRNGQSLYLAFVRRREK
jgi:hypothetical protein